MYMIRDVGVRLVMDIYYEEYALVITLTRRPRHRRQHRNGP